ncbi:MAG: hypothetical protein ACYCU3_19125 [Streptosporangiaceae bacterium]
MSVVAFRPARPDEVGLLGDLALRSKGHWGYDREFLDACRSELAFRAGEITARRITVPRSRVGCWGSTVGAERVGDVPSGSVPGRKLPLLRFSLSPGHGRPLATGGH